MTNPAVRRQLTRQRDYTENMDYYPTPPWVVRVLLEHINISGLVVWEPAAGAGHMSETLKEGNPVQVLATDNKPKHNKIEFLDFLMPLHCIGMADVGIDWVITNPPFKLLDQFIDAAHDYAEQMAFFCRLSALEGQRRGAFYAKRPPSKVLAFSERVQGISPNGFDLSKQSMVAYCWLIWDNDKQKSPTKTLLDWVPVGTAERLTKEGDYDEIN